MPGGHRLPMGEVRGAQSSMGESPQRTLPQALGAASLPQAVSPCSEPATLQDFVDHPHSQFISSH